jgi:SAM-dependent methyltransferase
MKNADDEVQRYANLWSNLTMPVRPSQGVLGVYRQAMAGLEKKRVLILGSTPELIDMAVGAGAERVVSIERSPTVIEAFRTLAEKDWSGVQSISGDWLEDRPEFHGRFNCIMCDGGILFLEYPGQWDRLFAVVHSYLEPGGFFAAKGWAEPPGDWNSEELAETQIAAFKASRPGLGDGQLRTSFIRLASILRLVSLVGAVRPDGSYDQKILVEQADGLKNRLEREFPDPAMIEIAHAALKYLARSQPGRTDTVTGAGYDHAELLLRQNGFDPRNFPLSDPPIDGSTFVFVARRA